MGKLDGRVAVITGGSRGIGRGIAEVFLAEGASVAISGRDAAKGARALEEMNSEDRAMFVVSDAMVREDIDRFVDEAEARFGRVDIAVANAGGVEGFGKVHALSDAEWQSALNWNLNHAFWLSRRVLPGMVQRNWGRVIAIASMHAKMAVMPNISHYIANKAAIVGLMKAVAYEYGPEGVTANSICPGAVETDILRTGGEASADEMGITYEEFIDLFAQQSMTKKLNTVEEVAAMATLLASEAGAGFTGGAYSVDAGSTPY